MNNMTAELQEADLEGETMLKGRVNITTLEMDIGCYLTPIPKTGRYTDSAPTHRLEAKSRSGKLVEVGVGWQKKISRGVSEGKYMVNILFNDPALPAARFAIFPDADTEELYRVTADRPRQAG